MEDIKTNFDKIMDKFNNSVTNYKPLPNKLNFESLENSFEMQVPKKRKLSLDKNDSSSSINKLLNDSFTNGRNSSTELGNSSIANSPWENRRMKADILEAKARIVGLKTEVDRQNKLRTDLEILYTTQVEDLKKQCEFSCNKVLDVEKHLTVLRKRETATKTELIKVKNELNLQKQNYEDAIYDLQRTNAQIEENSRSIQNSLRNDLSEYRRQIEDLEKDLTSTLNELESLRANQVQLIEKVSKADELSSELEIEKQQHNEAISKIRSLEFEMASYGEWKEMSKRVQDRVSDIPNLEREINRLQKRNNTLQENIGNKLLLEEEVYDLKSRLDQNEKTSTDIIELKTKVEVLEYEIQNWRKVAEDHCLPNTPASPNSLRTRIEEILQNHLVLKSDTGNAKSEKDTLLNQIYELKTANDLHLKHLNEKQKKLEERENILLRAKKKHILVVKERDFFKQLVENYEKDLTITNATADAINPDAHLRTRLELLEKTLLGYKTMCQNLQEEIEKVKQFPEIQLESIPVEGYEHLKKEIEVLRIENDRLKRRKEELELEVEHRCLKDDFNAGTLKILHLKMNPADEAYDASTMETEKLQAEIERLKRKLKNLEEQNEEITTKLNETTNMTDNFIEINSLRSKLESAEARMQHFKEVYKSASLEFREVCYMLFGFKIDRIGNANYRIYSMYAESEHEYLNFRLNEAGYLDMLETNYSVSLTEMVQTHLVRHKSLPAFLSSLTLELFNRVTLTVTH